MTMGVVLNVNLVVHEKINQPIEQLIRKLQRYKQEVLYFKKVRPNLVNLSNNREIRE